jgi:16S rRNA processing protein RimM
MDDDLLLIGRVARAHGNRGQVIVNPDTDFAADRFRAGRIVQVGAAGHTVPRRIESVRFHQGRPIVALEGVATMNDAEALAGAELWMPASSLAPLPADTFYRHDLVGCEVRRAPRRTESDGDDAIVGLVIRVDGTLERSHLVVRGRRGEVLIPLTAAICVTVDPAARLIVIDPPEGLLEANETRGIDRA